MQKIKFYVLYLKDGSTWKELFVSPNKEDAENAKLEKSFDYNSGKLEIVEEFRNKSFRQIAEEGEILEDIIENGNNIDEPEEEVIVVKKKPVIVLETEQPRPLIQPQKLIIVERKSEDDDDKLAKMITKAVINNPKTIAIAVCGGIAFGTAAYFGIKAIRNRNN